MAGDDIHNDRDNVSALDDPVDYVRRELFELQERHRDLDDSITALERAGTFDQLQVQRLKKQKLVLKDKIGKLKALLHPDIIA